MAGVKARKFKWMWSALTGNESDAIEAEHGVGRDMAAVVQERHQPTCDTDLQAILDQTGAQLSAVVRNKLHQFKIGVVTDDQPTAYALPGGFIFVTRSLTELCGRNPDELAFVVAHEMAHVIRRHAINRVLRQTTYTAASMLAPGRGAIAPWLRRVGLDWLELAYSRDQEFEADALGGLLTEAAGFDPTGAVRLLERFRDFDGAPTIDGLGAYLSTHPPVHERISRLQRRLDQSAKA